MSFVSSIRAAVPVAGGSRSNSNRIRFAFATSTLFQVKRCVRLRVHSSTVVLVPCACFHLSANLNEVRTKTSRTSIPIKRTSDKPKKEWPPVDYSKHFRKDRYVDGNVPAWDREEYLGEFRLLNLYKLAQTGDHNTIYPMKKHAGDVVPLPLRMGFDKKPLSRPPPDKYVNKELMKIPNFLHLTPPAIKKHCDAIKQFCTPWPAALSTEADYRTHLPLTISYNNYIHAGPSLRDERSRIVTLKFKLADLQLKEAAREKFRRLVGDRYEKDTDTVTIQADRCPTRQQNMDYVQYLLTVCYHEANKEEPWESEKSRVDSLEYFWKHSKHAQFTMKHLKLLLQQKDPVTPPPSWVTELDIEKVDDVDWLLEHSAQVRQLANDWETATNEDCLESFEKLSDWNVLLRGLKPYDDGR